MPAHSVTRYARPRATWNGTQEQSTRNQNQAVKLLTGKWLIFSLLLLRHTCHI